MCNSIYTSESRIINIIRYNILNYIGLHENLEREFPFQVIRLQEKIPYSGVKKLTMKVFINYLQDVKYMQYPLNGGGERALIDWLNDFHLKGIEICVITTTPEIENLERNFHFK